MLSKIPVWLARQSPGTPQQSALPSPCAQPDWQGHGAQKQTHVKMIMMISNTQIERRFVCSHSIDLIHPLDSSNNACIEFHFIHPFRDHACISQRKKGTKGGIVSTCHRSDRERRWRAARRSRPSAATRAGRITDTKSEEKRERKYDSER